MRLVPHSQIENNSFEHTPFASLTAASPSGMVLNSNVMLQMGGL